MCVTLGEAIITGTQTYTYATTGDDGQPLHVTGYQNEAHSRYHRGPNCMFLNFAGRNLQMMFGPERTQSFMDDMTARLMPLRYVATSRSASYAAPMTLGVVRYGDYDVVLAQDVAGIFDALHLVRRERRPQPSAVLEMTNGLYAPHVPGHSFALACFDGRVKPTHPIVVKYEPLNPDVLTVPGLDGHDGTVPDLGLPVARDFKVAFGVAGLQLPHQVTYSDLTNPAWAPASVAGFYDNRSQAPNADYVVPVSALREGLNGIDLAAVLQ